METTHAHVGELGHFCIQAAESVKPKCYALEETLVLICQIWRHFGRPASIHGYWNMFRIGIEHVCLLNDKEWARAWALYPNIRATGRRRDSPCMFRREREATSYRISRVMFRKRKWTQTRMPCVSRKQFDVLCSFGTWLCSLEKMIRLFQSSRRYFGWGKEYSRPVLEKLYGCCREWHIGIIIPNLVVTPDTLTKKCV
jgi:hypothetical protein